MKHPLFTRILRILSIAVLLTSTLCAHYLRKIAEHGHTAGGALALDDKTLARIVEIIPREDETERYQVLEKRFPLMVEELRRAGVTRMRLWEEYRQEVPGGYGYSQFCEHFRRWQKAKLVVMILDHKPGEEIMMDYCSYIDRSENILITGATGCGKSFLACALGHQACLRGYKTMYLNMTRFIERATIAKLDGSLIKLLNQIEVTPLLILDDFGLQPLDQSIRLLLLQILEDRYEKRSTVIASQLPIGKWHEYIADGTLADAILDRLTAHYHRIELKGPSLRSKSQKDSQ